MRIVGVEPSLGHTIQGLKNVQEAIVPKIYREGNLTEKITVFLWSTCPDDRKALHDFPKHFVVLVKVISIGGMAG